jgi:hypothetical protein
VITPRPGPVERGSKYDKVPGALYHSANKENKGLSNMEQTPCYTIGDKHLEDAFAFAL